MGFTDSSSGTREWSEMAEWIATSLAAQPVGFTFEIGPSEFIYFEDRDQDVACIQALVLENRVVMLRRSRQMLRTLQLGSFSTHGLPLDLWQTDDHFDDCTDGYIFSRDRDLIAGAVVVWFRDTCGISSPDELGCEYRRPDTLLPDN